MKKISLFLMVALLVLTFGNVPMSIAADLDSIDESGDYMDNVITDGYVDENEEKDEFEAPQVKGNTSSERLTGVESVKTGSSNDEPNDTIAEATALSNNTTKNGTIGTSTDLDFYSFTVDNLSSLLITMTPPSDKDYDIRLYDSTGKITLANSSKSGNGVQERITSKALMKGKYYIRVKGYKGACSTSQYSLSLNYTTSNAPMPSTTIDYSISTAGTFLYSNNPESINDNIYMADPGLGGHSLMEETVNAGTVQFFAEHANCLPSQSGFGMCLRVKNISTNTVTVTVLKSANNASASDNYGINAFVDFYKSKINAKYTIQPGETADILYTKACPYQNLLVAIVRFKVTGTVQVSEYLYQNSIKKDATYIGYIDKDKDGKYQKNYKGVGITHNGQTAFPIVSNTYSWEIDDYFSGKLPAKVQTGKLVENWYTNCTYHKNTDTNDSNSNVHSDIIWYKTNGAWTIFGKNEESEPMYCNLGNWSVEYNDTYIIKNNGSKSRKITIGFSDKFLILNSTANAVTRTPSCVDKAMYERTFTVAAHKTKKITIRKAFVTNIEGKVKNYVRVD